MSDECIICVQKMSSKDKKRGKRREVVCPDCGFVCCLECFKRVSEMAFPACMNPECDKVFNRAEMRSLTDNSHCKKVEIKKAEQELERQKSLMPHYQPFARREKEVEKCRERCSRRQGKIDELYRQIYQLRRKNHEDWQGIDERAGCKGADKKKIEINFIKHCSHPDCRGLLIENKTKPAWECGLCTKLTCKKCHEAIIEGTEHVCSEDAIKTVEEIKKSSKPCPECGVGIFKISGCDQMFCVQCETAFSWQTGEKIYKNIHNPHYFALARQRGLRALQAPEAGECIDPFGPYYLQWVHHHARRFFTVKKDLRTYETITHLNMVCRHIHDISLGRLETDYDNKARVLGVRHILHTYYNEELWFNDLKKILKERDLKSELADIIRFFIQVCRTVFSNLMQLVNTNQELSVIHNELEMVKHTVQISNEKFEETKELFNSKRRTTFVMGTPPDNMLFKLDLKL